MMQINKNSKSVLLTLAISSALVMSGCGGSSSSTGVEPIIAQQQATEITLERGPVLYAHVMDAVGVKGEPVRDDKGEPTNRYDFMLAPTYPISATGGYIDLDASGDVSDGDLALGNLVLHTQQGNVITLASSLAEGENLEVLERLGFDYEQLTTQTPSSDLAIAALSDEVFAYALRNGISDLTKMNLAEIESQIATRMGEYLNSGHSAIELERALIDELESESVVTPIDQATAENLLADGGLAITQQSFDAMPLTPQAQDLITFSWDEEKMAKDLYLNLYAELQAQGEEIKPLYNVATNSESKHQDTMQSLASKYDLDLIGFANSDGNSVMTGYDETALAALPSAQFILPEVQAMYDDVLWAHYIEGGANAVSALEAACMVEVIDVNDLNQSIDQANGLGAYELVVALESLRSGSYNHYWAFDSALVQQGVAAGCGSLGEMFDQDYPQVPKGGNQGRN